MVKNFEKQTAIAGLYVKGHAPGFVHSYNVDWSLAYCLL